MEKFDHYFQPVFDLGCVSDFGVEMAITRMRVPNGWIYIFETEDGKVSHQFVPE